MQAIINGETHLFAPSSTLATLVEALALDVRKVAIEQNLTIIPRSLYGQTPIADGDRIEIVQFIGGG